jgi:nucleoside-diphosphate-sugar epimerase
MNVAITGGSGRLGSLVARERPGGWNVRRLDTKGPADGEGDFHPVDVGDLQSLTGALEGADAVVHLAAIINPYVAPPEQVFRVNALGTYNVTLACEVLGIPRIIFASSICYYGYLFRNDFVAPPYLPVDEDTPAFPEDSYSLSKRVGEEIMRAFVQRSGGAVASLRFCYLMEGGADHGVVSPNIGRSMPLDERRAKSWWTYVDVRDAAQAVWRALHYLEGKHSLHEAFNIGADDTHILAPTVQLLDQFFPGTERRFGTMLEANPHAALYSNTKARTVLGFRPTPATWRDGPS